VREPREEPGIKVELLDRLPGAWPLGPRHVLHVWRARLLSGEPAPLQDHDAVRRLAPAETFDVPWPDQDLPAVRSLRG
jgi:8-oxo-dGTP diphosphatase